ncbi:MAG TPA: MGMT family protein [Patescibacteria group bacterium]|nr:MGMT family protein [Patescibacteria group bacterium]
MKPTWLEKLKKKGDLPKVVKLSGNKAKRWGGKTLAIPCPEDVAAIMKKVPKGKVITTGDIRTKIAKKYKAEAGCPLTTGIFTWIAANASEEADLGIPYWRTLKTGGELNDKYPGGIMFQKSALKKEGHKVVQKGKKWIVENFGKK